LNFSRENQVNKLNQNNNFELLIIGGGIVGAAALEMASNQNINTLLVEKNDFSSGASSRSTKLLHGGIRYLPQMQFGLVRESLQEQKVLKNLLGDLYKPLDLVTPIYKDDGFADLPKLFQLNNFVSAVFKFGLSLYDFLGSRRKSEKHQSITKEETISMFPYIKKEKLKKSFLFRDAQTDDAKLVLTLLRNAVEVNQSTAINYLEVLNINKDDKGYNVELKDTINEEEYKITCNNIIAATGTHSLPGQYLSKSTKLTFSGGAHLVLKGDPLRLNNKGVLLPRTEDNRVMFVLPWLDNTIVGTTDTKDFSGNLDIPFANENDIEYLIRNVKKYFDIENIDYISSWSGVRALIGSSETSSKNISRGHFINNIEKNFVQVAGGKLTGFRIIAKEALRSLFNNEFELSELDFVEEIINIDNQLNNENIQKCIENYSAAKPVDYMIRRSHLGWFNKDGGKDSIDEIVKKFKYKNGKEETLKELKAEGLIRTIN
tara:strand:- start:611 stop:2074 length:1464 start_codon:yes stop_codon:yes gene_type:complete